MAPMASLIVCTLFSGASFCTLSCVGSSIFTLSLSA